MSPQDSVIIKKIEKLEEHQNKTENKAVKKNTGQSFIYIFLYLIFLFWFIMNIGLMGAEFIARLLMGSLKYLGPDSNVLGLIPVDAYLAFITLYILIMFYSNILFTIPYIWLTTIESSIPKIIKILTWQVAILLFLLLPTAITTIAISDGDDFSGNIGNVKQDTQSRWEKLMNGPLCYLSSKSASECMAKQNEVDAQNIKTDDFRISLTNPVNNYILLNDLKERKFYIDYKILAKGEGVELQKLECYISNINSKPVFTLDLTQRQPIKNNKEELIDNIYCDFSDLEFDKQIERDFKIIPVLYYQVKTSYSIKVPFYNMDQHLLNEFGTTTNINVRPIEENLRNTYGKVEPVMTNNALKFTSSIPMMPVFIGEYYNDREYRFVYTFTRDISSLGDIISSEVLSTKYPTSFECQVGCTDKFDISTYEGKSNFILIFKLKEQGYQRDMFYEDLGFTIQSSFKKRDTITMVVENKEYGKSKEEEKQI